MIKSTDICKVGVINSIIVYMPVNQYQKYDSYGYDYRLFWYTLKPKGIKRLRKDQVILYQHQYVKKDIAKHFNGVINEQSRW